MEKAISWVPYIEAFVDSTRSVETQKAGVEAVADLVRNDVITMEALVKEMELYLTTTDDTVRARGILFLAEILDRLLSNALDKFTISSLVRFFSSRLADWRSLRGALIGCLALLKRTNNVGMIIGGDAKTLAQSMLDNVQVQLLAMHDRKLCFKVFQCLLDLYPESVAALGDDFVYGLIQAVDQEKDPRCLILTFHLVQRLVKLFLSLLGSAHVAQDIFEVLSCYFPIYFTHKIADDFEVKREELSDALMNAFCSTPYFEPFAIPLLLDKLSSSLPIAKIDSLKYLNKSLLNFGAERMMPHALSIWSSLKNVILPSPQAELLSPSAYILGREINSHENEIARESLICLKTAILQFTSSNNDDFLTLIFDDVDVKKSFFSVPMEEIYSVNYKTHLHLSALGNIFSAMASSSLFCCNKVFQSFFPRLMEILGIDSRKPKHSTDANFEFVSQKLNYGAVYLCVEMLISSCDLISSVWESSMLKESVKGSWWHLIQEFSDPLIAAFRSSLMNHSMITAEDGKCNSQELVLHCAKGLRVLATYPGEYTPVTGDSLKDILLIFMSIVMGKSEMTFLWKSSLMSLVQIRSSISRFKDSFMQMVYDEIVVKRVVLLLHEDSLLPLVSILEVISEIGTCAPDSISPVIQGLEKAMLSNFSQACVDGSSKSAKDLVLLLDCYCTKLIPWCHQYGSILQPGMHFTISLLDQMENMVAFEIVSEMQDLLDKMMMAMKLVVRGCTEDNQYIILEKAYNIMLASTNLQSESTLFFPSILEGLKIFLNKFELTCKTKWVMYFFASIVVALRQLTPLTSVKKLLNILLGFTLKGHLPAAQALASLVNKLSSNDGKPGSLNSENLEEIIKMILDSFSSILINDSQKRPHLFDINDGDTMQFYSNLQVHAVEGMAWLGKSLLMRGHSRVKDVSMVLLKCLLSNQNISPSDSHHGSNNCIADDTQYLVARSATDAFHLILSDSHACLNKNLYAIIRPLYKQRFYTSMLPVFSSAIKECNSLRTRALLYRAFGHTISSMPVTVLVADTNKVFPLLLDGLSVLDVDILNKDLMYNLILVLSGFLVDEKGREEVIGYAHIITNQLAKLIFYPHMMVVREAAIECLTALTGFPYTRIYPLRTQVLRALLGVLDDKKRTVRREAVKCYHAWASITSGSFPV